MRQLLTTPAVLPYLDLINTYSAIRLRSRGYTFQKEAADWLNHGAGSALSGKAGDRNLAFPLVHFADLVRFPRLQAAQSVNCYAGQTRRSTFLPHPLPVKSSSVCRSRRSCCRSSVAQGKAEHRQFRRLRRSWPGEQAPSFNWSGENQRVCHLAQLAHQLPCYRLALGPELTQIPALIAALLIKL